MPGNEEHNIAVVQRFIDQAVNGRQPSVIDETWSDDVIWHGGSLGTFEGRQHSKKHSQPTRRARGATCTSVREVGFVRVKPRHRLKLHQ
jgi:hypothetical protein